MHQNPQQWMSTLIPIVIIAIVLSLRLRNMGRARKLNIYAMWIVPALYTLVVIGIFWSHPPHGLTWLYVALAFAIGLPLGWYRGKLMHIHVDPETNQLRQTASPAALLFIVVLIAARFGARYVAMRNGAQGADAIFAITDILMAFALGFLAMQRVEMGLRANALLAQARNGRAS